MPPKPKPDRRDRESCWSLARRRAEHARLRAKRRKPGVIRDLLTSPEGSLTIAFGFAAMNVIASLGRILGEALAALWVMAARRRAEVARVQPKSNELSPPVGLPAAHEVRKSMKNLNLESYIRILEARSRGHRVPTDAPLSADAWSVIEGTLPADAALYLRAVEKEGAGAWTPVRYDLVKRPAEATEIWRSRGQAIREEAEADAMKPKAKPNPPKPDGGNVDE